MELSADELRRYARHLSLPEVGAAGQRRLKASRVLIVGAGGLGSPVGLYLAAAGVGHLGIVDHDVVSLSNLQRQILFATAAVERPKAEEAALRLRELNPGIEVTAQVERVTPANARDFVRRYDVVVDGSDNFATRYAVNDACVLEQKILVHGAVSRFDAQLSVFAPGGPCYRCLYPEAPPPEAVTNCAEGGVLGVLPGTVGTLMATEVLKVLLGIGTPLTGTLLTYHALSSDFQRLKIARRGECRDHVKGTTTEIPASSGLTPQEFRDRQARSELLVDVRSEAEFATGSLPGAINLPLPRLAELTEKRPLVLFCQTGRRSARAVELLQARGFSDVHHLAGGLDGLPHGQ